MTKATWNRIAWLADKSFELDNVLGRHEEAARLDERINGILLRAGIDQYPPEWDMIYTDYESGIIEVYNAEGRRIRTFNVLEARPKVA